MSLVANSANTRVNCAEPRDSLRTHADSDGPTSAGIGISAREPLHFDKQAPSSHPLAANPLVNCSGSSNYHSDNEQLGVDAKPSIQTIKVEATVSFLPNAAWPTVAKSRPLEFRADFDGDSAKIDSFIAQ